MDKFYQKVLLRFKLNLVSVPRFSRLVIYESQFYCDYQTRIISIKPFEEFASDDFYIDSLRGRSQGNITGYTIRNAFQSIKKLKSNHFVRKLHKYTNLSSNGRRSWPY